MTRDASGPRIGLFAPQGVFSELADLSPEQTPGHLAAFCAEAERCGVDSLWVSDHFVQIRPGDGGGILEGWTLLTALAHLTTRVDVGSLVFGAPFRNPGLLAHMAATLDVLSGGRLVLGVGAGWHRPDFDAYGYDLDPPGARIDALERALVTIRGEWTGGSGALPATPRPGPPIVIGGAGRRTLGVVARHADMANVTGPPERFAEAMRTLDEWCHTVGRDPADVARSWMTMGVVVADTETEARRTIERWREADDVRAQRAEHVGSPERIAEGLAPYVEAGCSTLILSLPYREDPESLERFTTRVLPLLPDTIRPVNTYGVGCEHGD